MREGKGASIMDYFGTLEDPRIDRCKRRQLLDIIAIAICAVICGADSWVYIELFGKSKLECFQTFLELPHGIPSHDTFGDVCSRLDPEQFQQCFMAWTQAVSDLVPGKWWPATARRYGVPTTAMWASGPSTWSAPGPRPTR